MTASGTVDTGTTGGDPGIGLRAINGGVIQSFSPLTVITGGANAIGAQALSGSRIDIFGGSSIRTSGVNADGLVASGIGSTVTATDTTVTLLTSGYAAIAGSGGFISTSGVSFVSPSSGVTALGNGTVTMINGSVTNSGVNSGAVVASGAAATITATGTAISGTAAGTRGVLAVNGGRVTLSSASVTSTGGGTAVQAFSVGQVTLNNSTVTADNGNALHATAGPNVLIAANGTSITTTGAGAHGALVQSGAAVDIAAGSTITTNGAGSHAVLISNASLTISDSTLAALGAGSDALRSSAGTINVPIARSTLRAAQGAAIAALGGTLNATLTGSSVVGGPLALQALNNSTLNLSADASTLTGTAATAAGSTSNVTLQNGSTWNVTGNSTLTNLTNGSGSLIQFGAPDGGVFKTVTTVNYVGGGGSVGLNTFLGADGSPSDLLVVNGGTASGASSLRVANTTGPGELTVANGILVVQALNNGTTSSGAFSLAGPVVAGPYEYSLYRGSVDGTGPDNWYLRSSVPTPPPDPPIPPTPPTPTPPEPTPPTPTPPEPQPPSPEPTPQPPRVQVPDYRREVSLYSALPAMGLIYGRTIIDSLHERVGELQPLEAVPVTEERTIWCNSPENNFRCTTVLRLPASAVDVSRSYASAGWGRIIGRHGNQDGGPGGIFRNGPNFDYDIGALQAGLDLYRGVNADGSRDHAGIYGVIGRIQGDVRHFNGIKAGTNTIDGYSLGAYWTHFGAAGWYLDGVVQGTWFDAQADSKRLIKLDRDGFGFAASLEAGYPIVLGNGWTVEPQAQLIYQTLVNGSGHDGAALVRFSDVDSLAGRVGARVAKSWALDDGAKPRLLTTWVKASLWNEFLGNPKTSFSSATGPIGFRSDLGGTWAEVKAGVDAQLTRNTAIYASAGYSVGTDGRSHAYDGRLGVKVSW
ncbi:autotransporter family protein [Bosea rubneri]|uniref:Autotransporter outer membrane beta-barrel domain-containing protein n=1 Tax=Bosea rubneri TaxID=3075434 RepID=A0ABU3S2Z5_9HYPH|nr:autotransporter outer membrane beta-barrel domain-containing protein [Bosea sp. ZW T0_25]MDU0339157.1 autotransporter outer membrane beta-barrel domain-containing protein [Bosea sp. ZW T0_25]